MGILKKEEILYANKDGEVQATEVNLYGTTDTTIMVRPMISEDLNALMELGNKIAEAKKANDEALVAKLQEEMEVMDTEVLNKHLIEPKLSAAEMKVSKPLLRDRIIKTIMIESGIPEKNLQFGYTKEGDSLIAPQ